MKNFAIKFLLGALLCMIASKLPAQVGINTDGSSPDNSSILDLKSGTKGILIPRMTYQQIMSVLNPANGLQVYCLDDNKLYIFNAGANVWKEVLYGPGTISPWVCGLPLIINHTTSGGGAPVNKTVTYGTVTNIPGEPSKCWSTSNLGATRQAVSVDDTSEAASGWYFQFNRRQGYSFIGTTRTPNTPWLSSIIENSEWVSVNDPCVNEIGYGWRLATITEWANVDASGNWTDWNSAWNSDLKLHGSGYLDSGSGWIALRGLYGGYWSGSQFNNTLGNNLDLNSGGCTPNINDKAYGFTVRCIKDAP
jgi:hypothetical protein